MKKKVSFIILLSLVLLIALSGVCFATQEINLRTIRFNEAVMPDDNLVIYVSVTNTDSRIMNDVSVRIDSPEIDIFGMTSGLEIKGGDTASFVVPVYVSPVVPRGDYYMRIMVSDDGDYERVTYRVISII